MVDFKLTDEQRQYRQLALDFAKGEIAPRAGDCDRSGEFPEDIYAKIWEVGLLSEQVPDSEGGLGLTVFDSCLIAEETSFACAGVSLALVGNNMAAAPLIVAGSAEQRREYLGALTASPLFASFCLTDHYAVNEPPKLAMTVRNDGGGEFVLSGQERWVTNAGNAKWFVVFAGGSAGISAFVVPGDAEGVVVGPREQSVGVRAADLALVSFNDVRVSGCQLVGEEGGGADLLGGALSRIHPLVASVAVGIARAAMTNAIVYAKERTTFGTAISNHQAVGFMVADMAKEIEAARLMLLQAAWLADRGLDAQRQGVMARAFAVDMAMKVAVDAVQVYGGYGYSREYPVEKLMRDAKVLQVFGGTSQKARVRVAADLVGIN